MPRTNPTSTRVWSNKVHTGTADICTQEQ